MSISKLGCAGLLFLALVCSDGCAADALPPVDSEQVGSTAEELVSQGAQLWSPNQINVCFQSRGTSSDAATVQDAIWTTWAAVADINFQFFVSCNSVPTSHVEIQWVPVANWWNLFGRSPMGMPVAPKTSYIMKLGFCDGTGDCSQAIPQMRAKAIHEMGHVLGMWHELKHPGRPADLASWCDDAMMPTGSAYNEVWVSEIGYAGLWYNNVCHGDGTAAKDCVTNSDCRSNVCNSGKCFGCTNNNDCQNDATCNVSTLTCIPAPCDKPAYGGDVIYLTPYDAASVMNYCRDQDGQPGDESPPSFGVDHLSRWDEIAAKLMYGGRPTQTIADSAGFNTANGWISSGLGSISPEYFAAGALASVYSNISWVINENTQPDHTVTMPSSRITPNLPSGVWLNYTDPWGRSRSAAGSVERNPSKFAAIRVAIGL
jgi:hypothetical protein